VGFFVGFYPGFVDIHPILFRFILIAGRVTRFLDDKNPLKDMDFYGDPGRNRTCDLQLRSS
jgi:hypothetical protein